MASLPIEILLGIYLGVLTGIVPALVTWALGFTFRYFTGVTVPGVAALVVGVTMAGVNGGLLALTDPSLVASAYQVRLTVALLVVLMGTLYAHSQGDKLGASLPRKVSLRRLTERTLSTDVVELVGGRGQVRVAVAGEVGDLEGYPPVPADLRAAIGETEWTFPADLPLPELETRVGDRLRTEFDLADVSVRLDDRARATVNAAPPVGRLSERVPAGKRAVSLRALTPTGLAPGDEVTAAGGGETYRGTVLGIREVREPTGSSGAIDGTADSRAAEGADGDEGPTTAPVAPVPSGATGGECRVTLAVDRVNAEPLLSADVDRLVVRSRGTRQEFEFVSVLRQAGRRIGRLAVREGGPLDGATLAEERVRETYGVVALAVRHGGRWTVAPDGEQPLAGGDDVFVVGTRDDVAAFEGAVGS